MDNIQATLEERGSRYGSFDGHASITQQLKIAMRKHDNSVPWHVKLSASQREALEMIAHKIGRILNGNPNFSDSWHDIAGYATLIENEINAEVKHV